MADERTFYRFARGYGSSAGIYATGDIVHLTGEEAAWFERDAPGCLEPLVLPGDAAPDPEPEERTAPKTAKNRQVKAAPQDRGAE